MGGFITLLLEDSCRDDDTQLEPLKAGPVADLEFGIPKYRIDFVASQTNVSRLMAVRTLISQGGHTLNAIASLTTT